MAKSSPECSALVEAGAQTALAKLQTTDLEVAPGQVYVTAAQLANRFGVGVKWVKAHQRQLGATPISDSVNSKLRYYLPTADAYMASRTLACVEKRRRPRAKRASRAGGEVLLEFV